MRAEKWRPIAGYDLYDVSDHGAIRSWCGWGGRRLVEPRALRPVPNHDGYPVISLTGTQGRRQFFVHCLVAGAFLGPAPAGYEVTHGNGDRADARLPNLRYATHAENEADKVLHGTRLVGERHPKSVLSDASVVSIRAEYAAGVSQSSLAARYGTHQTNISLIVRGKSRTWVAS